MISDYLTIKDVKKKAFCFIVYICKQQEVCDVMLNIWLRYLKVTTLLGRKKVNILVVLSNQPLLPLYMGVISLRIGTQECKY